MQTQRTFICVDFLKGLGYAMHQQWPLSPSSGCRVVGGQGEFGYCL